MPGDVNWTGEWLAVSGSGAASGILILLLSA